MNEPASTAKKSSRRMISISATALVLILVIALAYFVPQLTKPPVPPTQPVKPKVLVVGTTDYVWGIDPYDIRSYMAHMVSSLVYDTLVEAEWTKEGWKLNPGLAVRWTPTDSKGAVWEAELRRDVFFHDGTPFNASCVKFSWERTIAGGKGESLELKVQVNRIEVIDNYKVRFTLPNPFAGFPSIMAMSQGTIVSPSAVSKWGDKYSTQSLAGTGPFKLESWIPGDEIVLVRNDNHWNKARLPKLNKIIWKFFKDPSTLKMALEKKEIDVVHRYLLTSDMPTVQANAGFTVYQGPEAFVRILTVNPNPKARGPAAKYLTNTLVRQAIAYAIDYERIAKLRGGERAYGLYAKDQTVPSIAVDLLKDFKYDPAKAKQLLTQAGYPNGIPEPFEMLYSPDAYGAEETDMATIIKSNLEAIGIPVNMRLVDSTLRVTLLNSGNSTLSLFSHAIGTLDPDNSVAQNYFSTGFNTALRWGFNRTDIDRLVIQAKAELNATKRTEIYQKIQMDVDGPSLQRGYVFLYRPWNYVIAWKYVKGNLTPLPIQRYTLDWTQVDIDPERRIS